MIDTTLSSQSLSQSLFKMAMRLMLACSLLPNLAHGQRSKQESSELNLAIANATAGEVGPRDVVVIANAGAVEAVPALEKQFERSTDVSTKMSIASGLVKLKDPDETYWQFLREQVTLALDSNVPDANFSPSQGKMMYQPPELQAWADAHKVSVDTAWQYATRDFPGKVLLLATAGDPRALPLLRRALQSENCLVAAFAAKGLAQIQDKDSIPLIIAAARRTPGRCDSLIAESLVYFDDAQAQSAVDSYMSKEQATSNRAERARGRGVFGW